jgi:hypothetical protein
MGERRTVERELFKCNEEINAMEIKANVDRSIYCWRFAL